MQEDAPEGLNKLTEREALMLAAPVTVPAADSGGADGAGPSTAAGAGTLPPLRNVDKEEALDVFVTDGWLGRHPDQGYCLGPRSLLELGPMILEMDVPDATRQAVNKALGYDA